MATQWWYGMDGKPFGYLADDGKWFYRPLSGEKIGYRDGKWIYTTEGEVIGYFEDEGKWIYNKSGHQVGYFMS